MYKFLYKKAYWIYFIIAHIRMTWHIFQGRKEKAIDIIYEHWNW